MNVLVPLLAVAGGATEEAARHVEPLIGSAIGWLWVIPALPLLGAALNLAFGWKLQRMGKKHLASGLAVGVMVLATLISWYVFLFELLPLDESQRYLYDHVWTMFTAGSLEVSFAFALDPLSMTMTLIVTTIATAIHIYSVGYMAEDPLYWKFFVYLNYFVFSMLLLVMGANFLVMFFGWEGVGLASYLLIGFWHQDVEKAKAGMKAFVVNRFGDFGFLIGLFILFWSLGGAFAAGGWSPEAGLKPLRLQATAQVTEGPAAPPYVEVQGEQIKLGPTVDFRELRNQIVLEETGVAERLTRMSLWGLPVLALVGIFMFFGAAGKSAQIPLYVWLPDAMAGPTPVSALIHAATMVTAGVYLVARLNYVYALSPIAMTVVALVGAATALFAATIGFFQHDIKKVLAYSTVSQLGFMFVGVGVGAFWVGIYHLLNHAAFKACLFLGSGSVIHGCHHEQDMRKMGGLRKFMPITAMTYLVATIAITGLPIANGFYSKDEILWLALDGTNLSISGVWIWILGFLGAMGTAYYMWRSYFFTFTGKYRGAGAHGEHDGDHDAGHAHGHTPHESPRTMTWVLVFLAALSILTVFIGLPHAWGFHPLLEQWLAPSLPGAAGMTFEAFPEHAAIEYILQVAGGVLIPLGGLAIAWWFYVGKGQATRDRLAATDGFHKKVWQLVYDKYRVDELYDRVIVRPVHRLAGASAWFDTTVIDGTVNLVGRVNRFIFEMAGAVDAVIVDGAVGGLAGSLLNAGRGLKRIQAQTVRTYLYTVLGGALAIVLINYVLFAQS